MLPAPFLIGTALGVIAAVIAARLGELFLARRKARWLIKQGAYEVGHRHYPVIVALHALFFLSLLLEVTLTGAFREGVWWPAATIFLAAQIVRIWVILTLGARWNTRIFVLPGAPLVTRGPYRYIRHPNYAVVIVELAALPLIFHAYFTAIVFTIANLLVLRHRVNVEEQALRFATPYDRRD